MRSRCGRLKTVFFKIPYFRWTLNLAPKYLQNCADGAARIRDVASINQLLQHYSFLHLCYKQHKEKANFLQSE